MWQVVKKHLESRMLGNLQVRFGVGAGGQFPGPHHFGLDYGSGTKEDSLEPDEYLAGIRSLIRESVRRLADTGSLWLLSPECWADQIGTLLSESLPRRNRIIWRETFGQYTEKRFPSGHRHLFWQCRTSPAAPKLVTVGPKVVRCTYCWSSHSRRLAATFRILTTSSSNRNPSCCNWRAASVIRAT